MPATRAQVMLFLVEIKKLVTSGSCKFIDRKKNLDALTLLGWTVENVFELICSLTPKNYADGPEPDKDFPGEDLWTFGSAIEGQDFYLKLKIRRLENGEDGMMLCVSFHPAEFSFIYPFKAEKG